MTLKNGKTKQNAPQATVRRARKAFLEGALEFTTVPCCPSGGWAEGGFHAIRKALFTKQNGCYLSSRLWRGQKRKSKELAMSRNWTAVTYWKKVKVTQERITEQHTLKERRGFWRCCSRHLWPFAWMLAFHRLKAVHSCSLQKCTKLSGFSLKLYHKLSMTDPPAYQMLLCIILRELLGLGLSACNSLFQGPSTCYTYFSVRPYVPNPLPPTLLN